MTAIVAPDGLCLREFVGGEILGGEQGLMRREIRCDLLRNLAVIEDVRAAAPSDPLQSVAQLRVLEDLSNTAQATVRMEIRSEEHTSELQSLMRIAYAVFCLKNKT